MNKVKRILYNRVPKDEETILELFDVLEMMAEHIKKNKLFRVIIEELENNEIDT